jgi:hypothetical protein
MEWKGLIMFLATSDFNFFSNTKEKEKGVAPRFFFFSFMLVCTLLCALFNHIFKALGRQVVNAVFVPSAGLVDTLQCVGDANAACVPTACTVLCEEDIADASVHITFLLLYPSTRADGITQ